MAYLKRQDAIKVDGNRFFPVHLHTKRTYISNFLTSNEKKKHSSVELLTVYVSAKAIND